MEDGPNFYGLLRISQLSLKRFFMELFLDVGETSLFSKVHITEKRSLSNIKEKFHKTAAIPQYFSLDGQSEN